MAAQSGAGPAAPSVARTNNRYVIALAAGSAVGGLLFGFDTSILNGAINGIRDALGISPGSVGLVTAIALIGCAVGAWFAGPISARIGRSRVMFFGGILITVGSLATAMLSAVLLLGLSRFVTGLGIGAASAVVPAYIAEISPTSIRGRVGSLWQFAIVIGQFLGLLLGHRLTRWAGSEAAPLLLGAAVWRWMFVAVAILGAAYIVIALRLPQSPEELIREGDESEAKALLARISNAPLDEQVATIEQTLAGRSKVVTLHALRGPRLGLQPIVWTGLLLAAFQQLVGINIVKTYSTSLWRLVGFSTQASFTISLITVLVSIASTVVAIALIDKVGRRTMLVTGAAAMALALATLALCFSTVTGSGDEMALSRPAGLAALAAVNVFAIAFGTTWGPVMWVMLGELFNSNIRTTAVAVCVAVNWITNWIVTRTFPLLADASLGVAYGLYTAFAALAFAFALRALPETRGRSLS